VAEESKSLKIVHLLRHAKSDRDNPRIRDHERPLASRGERAGKLMAGLIARAGVKVDRVYSSTSRRTRETYELVAPSLNGAIVSFREDLYLADANHLLEFIRDLPAVAGSVMLIGHNPGFHDLGVSLVAPTSASPDIDHLREKFPTAALCSLEFSVKAWREVKAGNGRLLHFIRPRDFE